LLVKHVRSVVLRRVERLYGFLRLFLRLFYLIRGV
jgi:hypothetical protein